MIAECRSLFYTCVYIFRCTIVYCYLLPFTILLCRIDADYQTVVGDNKEEFEKHMRTQIATSMNISEAAIVSISARPGERHGKETSCEVLRRPRVLRCIQGMAR